MRGHDNQNKAWAEAQDERRYMQETRRAAAAAHQRQLWKQQKEKRMNRKGARAQMLLAQAFEQHGGKVPEGEAMENLVEATKCSPTEIEGWFKCESSNGQPQPLTRRLMPTVAANRHQAAEARTRRRHEMGRGRRGESRRFRRQFDCDFLPNVPAILSCAGAAGGGR